MFLGRGGRVSWGVRGGVLVRWFLGQGRECKGKGCIEGSRGHALLGKRPRQQPGDDGQVLALVEGGQDDRVRLLLLAPRGRRFGRRHCAGYLSSVVWIGCCQSALENWGQSLVVVVVEIVCRGSGDGGDDARLHSSRWMHTVARKSGPTRSLTLRLQGCDPLSEGALVVAPCLPGGAYVLLGRAAEPLRTSGT